MAGFGVGYYCGMTIGIGIFLIVVGAILRFAVNVHLSGLNLHMIGWILMGAGALVTLIALVLLIPRTRRMRTTAITTDSLGRQYVTERDDRYDGGYGPTV